MKDREFVLYTGPEGKRQFDAAIAAMLGPRDWNLLYKKGKGEILSEAAVNKLIKTAAIDQDVAWKMILSDDDETKRLISEILYKDEK